MGLNRNSSSSSGGDAIERPHVIGPERSLSGVWRGKSSGDGGTEGFLVQAHLKNSSRLQAAKPQKKVRVRNRRVSKLESVKTSC